MFGIGVLELVIVAGIVLIGGLCFGGLVALLIVTLRASQRPKNCPHCGKPLP